MFCVAAVWQSVAALQKKRRNDTYLEVLGLSLHPHLEHGKKLSRLFVGVTCVVETTTVVSPRRSIVTRIVRVISRVSRISAIVMIILSTRASTTDVTTRVVAISSSMGQLMCRMPATARSKVGIRSSKMTYLIIVILRTVDGSSTVLTMTIVMMMLRETEMSLRLPAD